MIKYFETIDFTFIVHQSKFFILRIFEYLIKLSEKILRKCMDKKNIFFLAFLMIFADFEHYVFYNMLIKSKDIQ